MNIKALESQEDFARKVLSLSKDGQEELFATLEKTIGKEGCEMLMKVVALYDMFTDERKYKEVEQCLMAKYLEEEWKCHF